MFVDLQIQYMYISISHLLTPGLRHVFTEAVEHSGIGDRSIALNQVTSTHFGSPMHLGMSLNVLPSWVAFCGFSIDAPCKALWLLQRCAGTMLLATSSRAQKKQSFLSLGLFRMLLQVPIGTSQLFLYSFGFLWRSWKDIWQKHGISCCLWGATPEYRHHVRAWE